MLVEFVNLEFKEQLAPYYYIALLCSFDSFSDVKTFLSDTFLKIVEKDIPLFFYFPPPSKDDVIPNLRAEYIPLLLASSDEVMEFLKHNL